MLKHIVMYKLKDTSPETLKKIGETFMSMKGKIDVLKDIKCGADVLRSGRSYDYALECVFESMEDMQVYQTHPLHLPVKAFMSTVAECSVCVDYEF